MYKRFCIITPLKFSLSGSSTFFVFVIKKSRYSWFFFPWILCVCLGWVEFFSLFLLSAYFYYYLLVTLYYLAYFLTFFFMLSKKNFQFQVVLSGTSLAIHTPNSVTFNCCNKELFLLIIIILHVNKKTLSFGFSCTMKN